MNNKFSVCISGWHFEDGFLRMMTKCKYPVHVVSHRPVPEFFYCGLPHTEVADEGLDFGAYSWFVSNLWDGKSDVLFCHDDSRLEKVEVVDEIAKLKNDVLFIFENDKEALMNVGKRGVPAHGRCIRVSAGVLARFVSDGGIWYDKENKWKEGWEYYDKQWQHGGLNNPYVNAGVWTFADKCKEYGFDVGMGICPQWKHGYRGTFNYKTVLDVT